MKHLRTAVVAVTVAIAGFGGLSAPAQASPCSFNGRNCYFAVICAQEFAGHQNPGDFVECLDLI